MLATTLGIEFDPKQAWEEREQIYKASGNIFKTMNISQSAEGNKDGLWTTTISVAVMIIDTQDQNATSPINNIQHSAQAPQQPKATAQVNAQIQRAMENQEQQTKQN